MRTAALLTLLALAIGCASDAADESYTKLRRELIAMAEVDQRYRRIDVMALPDPKRRRTMEEGAAADRRHTTRLRQIVTEHGWPTKTMVGRDGAEAAFLIVQHADHDPAFQADCLSLLESGYARGEVSGSALAYLTDRVLVKQKRPQRYGTQYSGSQREPGGPIVYDLPVVESVEELDERRAAMGLGPWVGYEQRMAKLHNREPAPRPRAAPMTPGYSIPTLDFADDDHRQVIVDREEKQYLGHPTTVLLEDGKTMLCVYPKGHGRGPIVMKRSTDGGKTWSERLPTPESWATSKETPTIHRVVDAAGKKRLILWSGLHPARLAVSDDDGGTWSELAPAGDWGGIVVMSCVVPLKTPGHYLAMFHDDGRFFGPTPERENPTEFTLYKTFSRDGGLTWSTPDVVLQTTEIHLCEPGCIRSPDGEQLAVLLRENSRQRNSYLITSDDEGATWSHPRELPASLTGDRHTGVYTPDGRLFISFRDTTRESPTKGDWVGWVGMYEDIIKRREGQYRVRLMDNKVRGDCAYAGVECLPDGTIVTTTYGHWVREEAPYIVSVRFKLEELDALARE